MINLIAGQRNPLQNIIQASQLYVGIQVKTNLNTTFDISCFGVNDANQLVDDRYFVFYNQETSPKQEIKLNRLNTLDNQGFLINLNQLPIASCSKLVFVITIDGNDVMSSIQSCCLRICDTQNRQFAEFKMNGSQFDQEKAIIIGELYFKDMWRFFAVGQGFNGGLSALLQYFGGEELKEETQQPQQTKAESKKLSLEKQIAEKAPHLISLHKKMSNVILTKQLEHIVAEVVLVLDASGSMTRQYEDGRVQMVVDRVIPLALQFDDNQTLDVWVYADHFKSLDAVTLNNINNYIKNQRDHDYRNESTGFFGKMLRCIFKDIGGSNNEPNILEKLITEYKHRQNPVYIIFISDGGVSQNRKIKELITEASQYGIFWQFIGLGGSGYGIFKQLDDLKGRVIDNCDFFEIDDLREFSDDKLYDLLLNEFPKWVKEAKAKHII